METRYSILFQFKEKVTRGLRKIKTVGDSTGKRLSSLRDGFKKLGLQSGESVDDLREKVKRLKGELDGKMPSLASSLGLTGLNGGLVRTVGGLFAVDQVMRFGGAIVETTAKYEKFNAVLTNTFQDARKAQSAMSMITDFAAKTPFQVDELTDSYARLASDGFVATATQMRKLGDLAAFRAKGFDQLTEAIIDAQVGEFERLKEFGIRASKQGDRVVFSFRGQKKEVAFTQAAIRDYILSLGDAVGVSGSMAAISQTTGGRLSNLKDNVDSLKLSIGEALRPAIQGGITSLSNMVTQLKAGVQWARENTAVLKGLAATVFTAVAVYKAWKAITMLVTAAQSGLLLAQIRLNLAMLANPVGLVIAGLAALAGAVVYAWNKFEGFRGAMYGLWEAAKEVTKGIKDAFVEAFRGTAKLIKGVLTGNLKLIKEGFKEALNGAIKTTPIGLAAKNGKQIAKKFNEGYAEGVADFRKDQSNKAGSGILSNLTGAANGLTPAGAGAAGGGSGLTGGNGRAASSDIGVVRADAKASRNVTINVEKLVEKIEVNTTNMKEGVASIKRQVKAALLEILNDANLAVGR